MMATPLVTPSGIPWVHTGRRIMLASNVGDTEGAVVVGDVVGLTVGDTVGETVGDTRRRDCW